MGQFKTKVVLVGGGPCDGAERILTNDQNLILVARVHLSRDKLDAMTVVQDTMCPHAYVRLDARTFAYDGLRVVEAESAVPVELRSFT
jgi:hypothetical protein